MNRRAFLCGLTLLTLSAPLAAEAQPAKGLPRVGWIGNMAPPPPVVSALEGFQKGLRELGYVEGQNVLIEYRWAAGRLDRLPELVADLVRLKVLTPRLSRVAVLYNRADPNKTIELRQLDSAARVLGLNIQAVAVEEPERLEAAFLTMTREQAQAVVTLADPFMNFHRRRIAELAAGHRLPAIYGFREYVDAGGLMSYGASLSDTFHRAAVYVDKILKGAKPADLPVEQPTKFELVINAKTAKALGLTIPPSLVLRADQVIE